ncbi:MAG: hypothetical protein JNK58_02450 [Phycisphaerae bacterium]|nr:hypothetical protein [Phycisphaerae bacterium]
MSNLNVIVRAAAVVAASAVPALAQWSTNPAVNNRVSFGPGHEYDQRLAPAPGGGVWVGWFESVAAPINFELRVQRYDDKGYEQFPTGGIVVSDLNNDTALFNWSMTSDTQGNCYLAFSDRRNGNGTLDVSVQKVTPAGGTPWGTDGINLCDTPDFEAAPAVTIASNGDCIVSWARDPSSGFNDLRLQRLTPEGASLYAFGGLVVPNTGASNSPGFVRAIPSAGGDVILVWLRNIQTFSSPRHIWAQRFDVAGNALWNATVPTIVLAQAVPIGYFPEVLEDGSGGAVIGWHRAAGVPNVVGVQRLLADGTLGFPAAVNGISPSTDATRYRYSPSISYNPATAEITVLFDERNSSQSDRGVYGNRIDAAGNLIWGNEGKVIVPLSQANSTSRIRHRNTSDNGVVCAYFQTDSFGSPNNWIRAQRLDSNGNAVWTPAARYVCSVLSAKDDPEILSAPDVTVPLKGPTFDATIIAWTDARNGTNDAYAQRINNDGSLGGPVPPVPCYGDADGSGVVDFSDITTVLGNWYDTGAPYIPGDADGSGRVDFGDITAVLAQFGFVCP